MTKSIISIFVFFSVFSSAELLLEITQGSDNPINLGIYEISSQGNEHTLIKNIIQNDLIRTGEIKFIEGVDIVPLPENDLRAIIHHRWLFEFSELLIWAPLRPHLGSRGALNSPQQLRRRPHGEADGPTKPPRPIWTCILTLCLPILQPKSMQTILRSP